MAGILKEFLMRSIIVLFFLCTLVFAQSDRKLYFEEWSTKKSNQNLVLAPTGTGVVTSAFDFIMSGTGQIQVPEGTTAQRSGSPAAGMFRFNSDLSAFEGYDGSAWGSIGGGGAGAPYIYEVTDFEGAVKAASFTCDTNLTAADDTSTPLNGNSSLTITQGATPPSVGAKCTGPNIAVPLGARNKTHVVYVPVVNGMNSGDLAVNIYDVTNTIELAQASLNASSEKKYQPINFKTASTTANIRIEFEVLVQNANAVAEFDDIYYQDRLDPVDVTNVVSNFRGEGNAAGSVTSSVTDVDFIEIVDSKGAWDGDQYTVQNSDSKIEISVGVSINTAALFSVDLYKNGTIYKNLASFSDAADSRNTGSYSSSQGEFSAGDVLSIRIDSTRTLANIPARHYLNITETAKENFVAVKGTSVNDIANTNSFSARIDNDGVSCTIVSENINIINGASCTRNGTGDCVCDFNNGVFSVTPTGQVVAVDTNTKHATFQSLSASSFRVISVNELGAAVDTDFLVSFSKQGTDFVTESDRTVIFNGSLYPPSCYLKDVRSAGTNGGTAATSYDSRVLNTASGDCTFLTQSGGSTGTDGTAPNFTLTGGKYEIDCKSPYLQSGYCKSKLVNTSDSIDTIFGTVVFSDDTATEALVYSHLEGPFTITASKTFQLQYECTTGTATIGLGATSGALVDVEVYSQCKITKLR